MTAVAAAIRAPTSGGGGGGGGGGTGGLTASVSSANWNYIGDNPDSPYPYIGQPTVTVTGGVAPYTFVWSVLTGDAFGFDPTNQYVVFWSTTGGTSSVKCIVTDAVSNSVNSTNSITL